MPIARPEPLDARVIAHVDMDCFYVQVEQRRQPELRGLPTAVVQYNSWKGGGLIAVSYEARKFGVKRSMRGDEAKEVCPDINLVQVPVARGKADLNLYRNAGSEVVSILSSKGRCERASIDEVYLDLTEAAESMLLETPPEVLEEIDEEVLKSHVLGVTADEDDRATKVREWFYQSDADHRDKLLACGAIIVAHLRMKVLEETKFTCSAGIAHNKMLAKLASAMNKPAQQTVVPSSSVKDLLATLPVKKMKQLGGKLGSSLQSDLGVNTVGDLLHFSEEKLQELYGINTGTWLWTIARGISGEEVEGRVLPKSHACGKTFRGPQALKTTASVEHWLNQLSEELSERIQSDFDHHKRVAHTLTLHASAYKANDMESQRKFPSKSCPLRYGIVKIQEDAKKLFDSALKDFLGSQNSRWGITSLSIAASKILDTPSGTCSILKFFPGKSVSSTPLNGSDVFVQDEFSPIALGIKSYTTESNDDEQQIRFDCEVTSKTNCTINQDRTLPTSDRKAKDKGSCSILRYFQGTNSHSTDQAYNAFTQDHAPPSSGSESCSMLNQTVHKGGTLAEGKNVHQNFQRSNTWALNVEDIDPSVIDELPLEIQKEVRGWLRPSKRSNTTKRGSTIAHYFSSSSKNS
ncbi:DNA polymerase eta isoform X2 [Asparagus officinalis]|uniref:DNA polymerase eta isoform X1 n=2 Tax=Asparagus officinalis TaxID=4686 RepID=UPI00098E411A|nr:DNA polymerase eta isoform X1 [Asparagus officinalis]XP_020256661.1 DNA polymerase eta isoform X2 [Asparagus officinalis]